MHYKKLQEILGKMQSQNYQVTSVFDIGANEGLWTKEWSQQFPNAQFTLFEANPVHTRPKWLDIKHHWISTVLSKPGIDKVDFYCMPNATHWGTGDSYYKEVTPYYEASNSVELKATTLDNVVVERILRPPQLIKLDTQGSEVDILSGANKTFETVDIVVCEMPIVEYNKGAPTFDIYMNKFSNMGFVPVGIDQDHFSNGVFIQIDMVFIKKHLIHLVR